MKRTITFLLTLTLLLTLAACGEGKGTGGEVEREIDTVRSFIHRFPEVRAVETEDTIYFKGLHDNYLKYMDKATGIGGPLCGKPECRHNNEDCNAYLNYGAMCILIDGERIYWINSGVHEKQHMLNSVALDGTGRREEAAYPRELFEDISGYMYGVLHYGWIYFGDIVRTIEDGEEQVYNYVLALPMNDKDEPFEILRERTKNTNSLILQVYGDYLYIMTNEESDESTDEVWLNDFKLRRWSVQTQELELLYEDAAQLDMPMEIWVTNDYVYFNRNTLSEGRIYRYEFVSGECEYLFDYGDVRLGNLGIADGIVTGYDMTNNAGIYDFYSIIKDFEGNVLVNETYTFDLQDVCPYYSRYEADLLGRDEELAYYSFYGDHIDEESGILTRYISIIGVALDGSGARVLCTETED